MDEQAAEAKFSFFKGADDVVAPKDGAPFVWERAASRVRENLQDALNAKHLSFLFGSGCSSLSREGQQKGIPTMAPLAVEFLAAAPGFDDVQFPSAEEREALAKHLGFDLGAGEFKNNLERLMEVLYSFQFVLKRSNSDELRKGVAATVPPAPLCWCRSLRSPACKRSRASAFTCRNRILCALASRAACWIRPGCRSRIWARSSSRTPAALA